MASSIAGDGTSGPLRDPAPVVLLVESEPNLRAFVRGALESHGYEMLEAPTAAEGIRQAQAYSPDLVVIDLELPDAGGELLMRRVREHASIPILAASARPADARKVRTVDGGADGYVPKPFRAAELIARIRAALRRTHGRDPAVVRIGDDVVIDVPRRAVTVRGKAVHLTPIEFKLLTTLAEGAGTVLTHHHLLEQVWGPGHDNQMQYLRVYMTHLRHKLEREPARPKHLLTETGVGYRLRPGP